MKPTTIILHSRADETIPFADGQELQRNSGLPNATLIEVGTEHRLADSESLEAMLKGCERMSSTGQSILDHPAISGHYLFPQPRYVDDPFVVQATGAELACYRRIIDPDKFTLVHFHGNGEAVADYIPDMADIIADLGLNSLFVEYREYGNSTGQAQLVSMLGDGEAAVKAAGLAPERVIAFGRSIGSLYAIELVHRQPTSAGLILESGIADASERFLVYAALTAAGVSDSEVIVWLWTKQHRDKGWEHHYWWTRCEERGTFPIKSQSEPSKWMPSTKPPDNFISSSAFAPCSTIRGIS